MGGVPPGWIDASGSRLPVLATLAVVADVVTTAAFLAAGVGTEGNGLLVAGLEHGILGGAVVFVATQGVLLAVAVLAVGAVSTYVATYLVVTMGLGGGLNNAVLLLTGESLLAPLGPGWAYLGPPGVATVAGIGTVWRRHDDRRWRTVVAVAVVLLGGEVISFVV